MITGSKLTAGFNPFASLFLDDFRNVSSARTTKKVKIINASGKTLTWQDYAFTTENTLPRTSNLFSATTGTLTPALNRAFGTAYTAMVPSITSPSVRTDLCIGVQGFDGKNINLMQLNLRTINDAVLDFYGLDEAYELTLPQMMHLDDNLSTAGYASYGELLRDYYGVASLYDLPLETAYHVLGTTGGAQTAVTNWRDNTIGGKPVPVGELGQLTNAFKIWGFLGLNLDEADRDIYPYVPNYYLLETDPEVIRFAYDYVYAHGLRFSFDQARFPFDTTDSEAGRGGAFGIRSFVEKAAGSNSHVNALFGGLVLKNGEGVALDAVTAGLYVPNAWNQYRLYDFGFNMTFGVSSTSTGSSSTKATPTPIPVPTSPLPILEVEGAGNGHTIPRTFDDTPIFWIVLMLAFSGSVILYELTVLLQRRRKKKHGQPG
jgi:hypothetical protein